LEAAKMKRQQFFEIDGFDTALADSLKASHEPLRPDFTNKVMQRRNKIIEAEFLAKSIRQERLALIACITLLGLLLLLLSVFGKDILNALPGIMESVQRLDFQALDLKNIRMLLFAVVPVYAAVYVFFMVKIRSERL